MSEIERAIDAEEQMVDAFIAMGEEMKRLRAEIDRLRAENERISTTLESLVGIGIECDHLRASNAELLAMLEEYVRDFGENTDSDSRLMADKARAAIARAKEEGSGQGKQL